MPNPKPHRLTDMDVHEVSVVDAAANKHKFLIVKSAEGVNDVAKSEVVTGADGKHTTVNKNEGGKLQVSAVKKAAILKSLLDFDAAAKSLREQLEKAEDVPNDALELPESVQEGVEQVMKAFTVMVPISKGYKQVTPDRLGRVRAIATELNGLLDEVAPAAAAAAAPAAAAAAAAPTEEAVAAIVEKSLTGPLSKLTATLGELQTNLATGLQNMHTLVEGTREGVAKQAQKLEALERARPVGNAGEAGGERTSTKKNKGGGGWGRDLNATANDSNDLDD